jgi:hypothetical protein
MKIGMTINFDINSAEDAKQAEFTAKALFDSIKSHYDLNEETGAALIEQAWRNCSHEVMDLGVRVLSLREGTNENGVYATFNRLGQANPEKGWEALSERAISSRVGRTAVVCKKLNVPQLMAIATRRKDQVKRVYVTPEAEEALLNLLRGIWGLEFNRYLTERGREPVSLADIAGDDLDGE